MASPRRNRISPRRRLLLDLLPTSFALIIVFIVCMGSIPAIAGRFGNTLGLGLISALVLIGSGLSLLVTGVLSFIVARQTKHTSPFLILNAIWLVAAAAYFLAPPFFSR